MRNGVQRVVFLLCLCFSVLVIPLLGQDSPKSAPSSIVANEASARLTLLQKSSVFSIELSGTSSTVQAATLSVRVVAADEKCIAEGTVPVQVSVSPRRAEVPLTWLPVNGLEDTSSIRLLYDVRLQGSAAQETSGILSPYRLIPELFELHFMGLDSIGMGRTYVARVWATRPGSDKPVSGVALDGVIGDEDEAGSQKGLKAHGRTNTRGEALLRFQLPETPGAPEDEEVDFKINGARGNFQNSLTATLHLWRRAAILLSTDKPLYQPEQTLHVRALLLDDQRRAWAKHPVRFTVQDPDDTLIYSSDTESSRFGIASVDWSIPPSQKLGSYRITANISEDPESRDLQIYQIVRISRYELPTFSLNVQSNQPFYLPGQNADVTISAAYLFGKPVLRGHMRLLREASRKWNYTEQKWDTDESVVAEGDLDAKNEFHATVNLAKDHAQLQETDWKRFEDIRFAAYLADESSHRTQERHFDLRISRDAIHLYVLNVAGSLPVGLPTILYVSSSLADGIPVAADVRVGLFKQDPSDMSLPKEAVRPFASTIVRTNHYGIAQVRFPAPLVSETDSDRVYVVLEAKTLDGQSGKHLESYSYDEDSALRITPTKTILQPEDPIRAKIESSSPTGRIEVQAIDSETQTLLASQELNLSHGTAHVSFAQGKQFAGAILLVAFPLDADMTSYSASPRVAATTVLFPQPTNLRLDVRPVKTTYRPGEAATVSLRVRGTLGEPAEGALGVLVYDQALEELARTEAGLSSERYERIDPRLGFRGFPEDYATIAGVSVKGLLNRTPGTPVPADLELVAQALLTGHNWAPLRVESSDNASNFSQIFQKQIEKALNPVTPTLQDYFTKTGHFPANDAEYAAILSQSGFEASHLIDPWGRAYHVRRTYQWTDEVLEFRSEGPDKTPSTADDFTALSLHRPFFEHDAKRLRSILDAYHARTNSYVRDHAALEAACEQEHTSPSSFVDPWGTPYAFEFGVDRENFTITVSSAGPDKQFRSDPPRDSKDFDDLRVSVLDIPYFLETSQRISEALFEHAKTSAHFPSNEEEFRAVMPVHGIDWDSLRDPWGRPYRIAASLEFGYGDKVTLRAYGQELSSTVLPVTRTLKGFTIRSDGPDLIPNSPDDFILARFASPFVEESANSKTTSGTQQKLQPIYSGGSGAVELQVKDASGAVIPNAKVTLTNQSTGVAYTGVSNNQGLSLLSNLPAGTYRALVESPGFRAYVLTNVPVLSSNVTEVEVTLNVGSVSQTVEVSAEKVIVETSASVSALASLSTGLVMNTKSGAATGHINVPTATPRLREYFPETLLWQPEVHTDRSGHTTVKFPLADSITTWKVSVIASTLDGHIATASAVIRGFQPFFAELDPPKVLTVGDEIHLPVTVRNYLEKPQTASLDWASEPWSQTLSARNAQVEVPAGDYAQKFFSFRAAQPMKDAKQRVSAFTRSSQNESDAIEKKLRIHADGQERIAHTNSVFSSGTTLLLDVPSNALPGSIEAELVVYPNLIAHVSDAIEGILRRPYGCAEQTISSAYPSLLWLQLQKSQQLPPSALDARAQHYLRLAYAKLLGYREPGGGFSYWGKGDPYIPLTAYALRFLNEASEFVEVDPEVIAATRHWLLQQATPQGVWMARDSHGQLLESTGLYDTTYVVQVLARDLRHRDAKEKDVEVERQVVDRAIQYLSSTSTATSDAYNIALFVLAKLSLKQNASKEIARLIDLRHLENETTFWDAQHNTVFYGWGFAGRIETTALVLDALATAKQQGDTSAEMDDTMNLGTLFLLKNKDHYGVWYSSQATVNVLQSLVRQLKPDSAPKDRAGSTLHVQVDGRPGPEFPLSSDVRQLNPQRVDLTSFLGPGPHRIELKGGSATRASAYLNAIYYLPWTDPSVVRNSVRSGDGELLRYSVKFDRDTVSTGESIRCTVRAERVGFRGYGMMLAEIGLPPGADVDRASLDAALSATWDLQSYEIQPDRVVAYLWPRAGGSTFTFALKPRFSMTAQSAESILYDYYNPEARVSVPPARFVVQ